MSTKPIRIPVEQVLRAGTAVPDNLAIGRCNSRTHDVGVAWPAGVAKLGEMAIPRGFRVSEGSAVTNPRGSTSQS